MTSLKGKKILVTIQELENLEHRGIAFYTKSLILALNKAEAEIWLLVSMDFKKLKFKNYKKKKKNSTISTFISDYLTKGVLKNPPFKIKSRRNKLIKIIKYLKIIFFGKSYNPSNSLKVIFSNK